MRQWREAREAWERDVQVTQGRARAAVGALVVTAGVRVFQIAVAAWQIALLDGVRAGVGSQECLEVSDALAQVGRIAAFVMLPVTAALFLRWLSRALRVGRAVSTTGIGWSPREAVWSFFLPVISIVRPYHVIRDLHDQLAPDAVPEPAARPRFDGAGDYRSVPLEKAPPPVTLPHASIGAWWALFIVHQLLGNIGGPSSGAAATAQSSLKLGAFVEVVAIAAALLAVLVVRALTGRLAERYRRVRHASDEELEAWGIEP
jgi:hypothetical protein